MRKKYQLWYDFVDTEEQAKKKVKHENAIATPYMRRNKPAHYTPWNSEDGAEHKYIVWSYR